MLTLIVSIIVIAWAWRHVILQPNMIGGRLADWMDTNSERLHYIIYPLGYCSKCFAGQAALWMYLIKFWSAYDWFDHLTVVCGALFGISVLEYLINRLRNLA